jgi:hypothetical protein
MKKKRVGLHSHLQLKNNTLKDHSHWQKEYFKGVLSPAIETKILSNK